MMKSSFRIPVEVSRILEHVLSDPPQFGLPEIKTATRVNQGIVHYVWRIECFNNRVYYLKIRSNSFATLDIPIDPSDIHWESAATECFHEKLPDSFPRVIYCDKSIGLLITSDVVGNGKIFETVLLKKEDEDNHWQQLGKLLRDIHSAFLFEDVSFRPNKDRIFYHLKLSHKIGFLNIPETNHLVTELHKQPFQLIIGDPSPKNIGCRNATFALFDLEDAHRGNAVFDVGFVLGHVLVHNFGDVHAAYAKTCSFAHGYGSLSDFLLKRIAVTIFLYRILSPIPYCVSFSPIVAAACKDNARKILGGGPMGWLELIEMLFQTDCA